MSGRNGLLCQLKDLVQQIDDCGCQPKKDPASCNTCCAPCEYPFAQVCFTCPPSGPLPTVPCPVKPLQMPCLPGPGLSPEQLAEQERRQYNSRYDNFYNNYNINYHEQALVKMSGGGGCCDDSKRNNGVTVDGKSPCCDDYMNFPKKEAISHYNHGCPTGFKPCQMKLCPPPCCNPIGVWKAQVLPCPPGAKVKKDVSNVLPPPECCTRPGCHHWKPEGGPCLYDAPCKAHCFNHPPGMKPSGKAACTAPPAMC